VTIRERREAAPVSDFAAEPFAPDDPRQRELLDRYCKAFESYDVEALVSLLREDAVMSMPPFAWWVRGRDVLRAMWVEAGNPCEGGRLIPAGAANGCPAFGQYRPDGGRLRGFALVVIELVDGRIAGMTNHLDADRLFPLFGLPSEISEFER
ncbi:nuclear transport factor 2 family protein, partial [Actinomadura adrarensis]